MSLDQIPNNQILGICKGVELELGLVLETFSILTNQHFPCDFTGVMVWLGAVFVPLKAMML